MSGTEWIASKSRATAHMAEGMRHQRRLALTFMTAAGIVARRELAREFVKPAEITNRVFGLEYASPK